MAAKYFIILACLALSQASVVKRDAPAATPTILEDVQKHASEFQATFTEALKKLAGSDTKEFQKTLKEGTDSLAQQMSAMATSLQSAIEDASGKAKETLQASQASIQRSADELRAAHPELEQHAGALKDKLSAAVQNTLKETEKVAKNLATNMEEVNKKVTPIIAKAFDDFKKQTEDVQKKLHEAATKQ